MSPPHPRWTVRKMMIAVAVSAVLCSLLAYRGRLKDAADFHHLEVFGTGKPIPLIWWAEAPLDPKTHEVLWHLAQEQHYTDASKHVDQALAVLVLCGGVFGGTLGMIRLVRLMRGMARIRSGREILAESG